MGNLYRKTKRQEKWSNMTGNMEYVWASGKR